ncbi:helicase-related protein, partial [Escherichia coli]
KLELKATAVFRQSFERPNISYSNFLVESKPNKIIDILQKVGGTGIVYCNNRRQTTKIADILLATGIAADYYHAGLTQDIREQKQEAWISNKIRVMVCT